MTTFDALQIFAGRFFIYSNMLKTLLPQSIFLPLQARVKLEDLTEIRIRVSRPIVFFAKNQKYVLKYDSGNMVVASKKNVEEILSTACKNSVYAFEEELASGFLRFDGGVRIGVSGEGVSDGKNLITMKNINFLCIRIPHEIKGVAKKLLNLANEVGASNVLIASPPFSGKTTLLRDYARLKSKEIETLILDERFELAGVVDGCPSFDVGDCDVLSGVDKNIGYQNAIRAMNPKLIVTDEIFSIQEVESLNDIVRSGVNVCASIHAGSIEKIKHEKNFSKLKEVFDLIVRLGQNPMGEIVEVDYAETT